MKAEIRIRLEDVEKFLAEGISRTHGVELASFGFIEKYYDKSGEGPLNSAGDVFFVAVTK